MGMDYYIIPDRETKCDVSFPPGLSYFFGQIGGYGENSLVVQLETIIDIDLSVFQKLSFSEFESGEEGVEHEKVINWIKIKELQIVLINLRTKLIENPDYKDKIKYCPIELPELTYTSGTAFVKEFDQDIREFQQHPSYLYPKNNNYLEDDFEKDVDRLINILNCLETDGIENIQFEYM